MRAHLHGGFCCGVKHISGLSLPAYSSDQRTELSGDDTSFGRSSSPAVNDMHRESYGEDFFADAAPRELNPLRLQRMVDYIKLHRNHGLIEVVIQKLNQKSWVPHLEALGFRMVTEFKNSNTSATLQVWHLTH